MRSVSLSRGTVHLGGCAALVGVLVGCGAARPHDSDIYHDPALRRGALEADDADSELLAQLGMLRADEPVTIAGRTYVPARPYEAASGRSCRRVQTVQAGARLACAGEDARWVFVPDVFGDDDPFAASHPVEATMEIAP